MGGMPWEGSLGVRFTSVDIISSGYQSISGAPPIPVTVRNQYTETLPSLNLVLHLTDDHMLRFGAGRAIARPPLDALVTAFNLDPIGVPPTGGGGNPFLRPYRSDQVDLSYEWYFHDESLFAIALFYKDIDNFIGASQTTQTIDGVQYIITAEGNGDGGYIRGAELTFQTRLYFLPGFLEDFGIYANYAVGESNIHEFAPASNPYPMIGLTDSTGEFDIFYNRGGLEARIAYKHHGDFTVAPTWVGTTLKEQSPEQTIDASISYDFGDHWSIRLNGRNLTNEPSRRTSDNNPQNLSNDGGYQIFGRTFLFDVAFRY
jgi:TonB-dependent receptor